MKEDKLLPCPVKKYPFWRDYLNKNINKILCFFFGHWYIPSEYPFCKETHEDCMLCGDFKPKSLEREERLI
jgi:hypothetical protein